MKSYITTMPIGSDKKALACLCILYRPNNLLSIAHMQRTCRVAVAYGNAHISRTIAIDEWARLLSIALRHIGKEAAALRHSLIEGREAKLYGLTGEKIGNQAQRNIGDDIAKIIDMQHLSLNTLSLSRSQSRIDPHQIRQLKPLSELRKRNTTSKVRSRRSKDIATVKGRAYLW